MQLRIWANLEGVDAVDFTHPVASLSEAKSVLSALPRFYDWAIDDSDDDAPDLLAGLQEREDEDDEWTTWLSDEGEGIWEVMKREIDELGDQ